MVSVGFLAPLLCFVVDKVSAGSATSQPKGLPRPWLLLPAHLCVAALLSPSHHASLTLIWL